MYDKYYLSKKNELFILDYLDYSLFHKEMKSLQYLYILYKKKRIIKVIDNIIQK